VRRFWGRAGWAKAVDAPLLRAPARAALKAAFRLSGFPSSTTSDEVAQTLRCLAALDFEIQQRNTAALRVPVLTAWATDDAFIEREVFEEHAAALPAGPRLSWSRGGHNIQKTQAVELARSWRFSLSPLPQTFRDETFAATAPGQFAEARQIELCGPPSSPGNR